MAVRKTVGRKYIQQRSRIVAADPENPARNPKRARLKSRATKSRWS